MRDIAATRSVIVVEHDMEKAPGLHVTVLHEGSVLADGTLAAVQDNDKVIEVYLGR